MPASVAETQLAPKPSNQIEMAIAQRFGDPDLWNTGQKRLYIGDLAGLKRQPHDDYEYLKRQHPQNEWVTLTYGCRVVDNSRYPVKIETTSLQTMVDIHDYLAQGVLAGERARPSVLVDPPIAKWQAIARTRENNLAWLQHIRDGVWPIMWNGSTYLDGSKRYNGHDYTDYHNIVSLLLPRESQDLITQVADCEIKWINQHPKSKYEEVPLLSLAGDRRTKPYGLDEVPPNGIKILDRTTSAASYVQLLQYLMHGEGATLEDRLRAVQAHEPGLSPGSAIDRAALGLRVMRIHTAEMVHYISRHNYRTNATPDEVETQYQRFLQGALRITRKILGECLPEDYEPQPAPPIRATNKRTVSWLSSLATKFM